MARYRSKPYGLVARRLATATVWYYYHYESGQRSNLISTGIGFTRERDRARTRREATDYCETLVELGKLGGNAGKQITLQRFVELTAFWDWHRSDYIRGIIARTESDSPGISETYVRTAAQITRDHILLAHGSKLLDSIKPQHLEDLLFSWSRSASHKSANNRRSVYSVILGEATRLGHISANPWARVPPLKPAKKPRGGLTIAEVSRILERRHDDMISAAQRCYYLGTKIAFLCGLRIGEVRGLLCDDVIDVDRGDVRMSYLSISKQHSQKLGKLTPTKDKDTRNIPISADLRGELEPQLTGAGRYLLSIHPRQATPISENKMRDWFYRRMDLVGITAEQRTERRITFHSARRFFNTLLRQAGVADSIVQRFTGHDSDAMTEHYTDYLPEDLQSIMTAQDRLLS
ncbi:tyrosine-type recombinase/integrase [Spirochaeta africana]|uniref:Site-specific recombinase XerD n=1 Tax=Spirochaeta africana (strain ATCC 700263 / DSM 8902 / Z-7692) TaxID=889378 RepID=H9UJC6_SPIAZ|nr:tyrosine-type recombinase/integrase [Spirochaeta africana]AFG37619.1 site-specific recombinase XerD [Spirochaeta africana DSM 8902]